MGNAATGLKLTPDPENGATSAVTGFVMARRWYGVALDSLMSDEEEGEWLRSVEEGYKMSWGEGRVA